MAKKKIIIISCILILLIQTFIPLLSYATSENEIIVEENNRIETIEENQEELIENNDNTNEEIKEETNKEEIVDNTVNNENTNEEIKEETDKEEIVDDTVNNKNTNEEIKSDKEENVDNIDKNEILDTNENEENENYEEIDKDNEQIESEDEEEINEELLMEISQNSDIMLLGAGDWFVGNESEFRNALANGADVIHVRQSIDFGSTVYINYPVRIVDESDSNAMRYGSGGNFFVVQNGGSLVIDGMVVDTNSSGAGGMTAINIQAGGSVTFVNGSIVDGGLGNTGILVNSGASLLLWSSHIVRCGVGINLQGNGSLAFADQSGRQNKFYWNSIGLYIDNFNTTCNLNQGNINMYENTNSAIYIGNSSGTVNISAGSYHNNNNYAIHNCSGTTRVSGGDFYSNGWALRVGGNLNLSGGSIHNNSIGVLTDEANNGKFTMTGGSIYSNTSHAIQHQKVNDGGCTITGGSISGDIYLQKNDNYVNTNASYPSFTVTPSTYWFKRKLVKTNSNAYANNEKSKVTLTPSGSWYKYVESGSQYIVLWTGGNVIVRCKDYYGNIIKTTTMNGTIGSAYSVSAPTISGYDLISVPSNANGTYTQNDIIVELKYDLVNVAKVNFEDLLSGVVSAKYWYNSSSNSFTGDGTNFSNGTIFENYGYYKVTVVNGVGLEKTITFTLNKNSYTR